MSIARVGSAPTVARGTTSPVATTWASGQTPTAGHLLLCFVYATGSGSTTIDTPSGWTSTGADVVNQTSRRCNLFYKSAAGSDAAPSISSTGATKLIGFVDEFSGWDGNAPTLRATNNAASGSTLTFTTSANVTADGIAVTCYGAHGTSAAATETPGTHFTQDAFGLTSADNAHMGGDYWISPTQGSTASEAVTINTFVPDAFVGLIIFFGASGGATVNSNMFVVM